MKEEKPEVIPVQYVPVNYYEEDEIDLKELFLTIWKHRWFVVIFTFVVTLAAAIYAFTRTPIYEVKANLFPGFIENFKNPLINSSKLVVFINSTFDMSETKQKLPSIKAKLNKINKKIISITIQDTSNQKDLQELSNIMDSIHKLEKPIIEDYKKSILQQINILQEQKKILINDEINYKDIIKHTQNPHILNTYLQAISDIENKILSLNLKIENLKLRLSKIFIQQAKIIGKIEKHDYPVKPKKKLIIVVAFVTGLILAIFLVFFIEFIKGFKEDKSKS
ncbi:Wzz/FepE/Etk N-terminal domain-containing protein [Hippea jasoniae]|uniref:Wzz/FepE/Etk N-terminal domain-containing protein n=1 Tax=Hippea jasoniae TaxID=944479 RepID=UPI00054E08AD|nr:Wzz/FepE/Etk N-terminal domain-containing protein [Hippea jasoniae]